MRHFFGKTLRFHILLLLLIGVLASCGPNVTDEAYSKEEEEQADVKTEESTEEAIANAFVPSEVKDITEIKKMRSWLEYFYYNNVFDETINNESGEITEDAMISFAASYIMQLEHKGLRFDTDTFRLYIPQKTLEEVVMRFFGHKVETHHSISKHGILFEEENYVIQANAREWPTRLDIIYVMEDAPKVYSAVLNGNNTEAGEIDHQIKAEFKWEDNRYVLTKYRMITDKEAFVSGNPLDVGTSGDEPGIESSGSFGDSVNPGNEDGAEETDPNAPKNEEGKEKPDSSELKSEDGAEKKESSDSKPDEDLNKSDSDSPKKENGADNKEDKDDKTPKN